jgi:membrane-associated phospholipid phosphatase
MISRDASRATPASDYNAGVPAIATEAALGRASWRGRYVWAASLLLAPVSVALLLPIDQRVADWAVRVALGSELRQELEAWQQYGAIGSLLFTALLVWQMDPPRRVRLWDMAMAVGVVGALVMVLKVLIGRARPGFVLDTGAPGLFVPAWAQYPYPAGGTELVHNWEAGARLWSMPSSHTAYAAILSVFLATLYPRFRWIGVGMAVLVGFCRVLFGAHYPSDVAAGALLATGIAIPAIRQRWGIRTRNAVWDYLILPTQAAVAARLASAWRALRRRGGTDEAHRGSPEPVAAPKRDHPAPKGEPPFRRAEPALPAGAAEATEAAAPADSRRN